MKSTKDLIYHVIKELELQENSHYSQGSNITQIPTLEKGVYREASPMLRDRFILVSNLLDATHGDWLSIDEMEALWKIEEIVDDRLKGISEFLISNIEHWENNAGSLFKTDRLSLFAGSAYVNEHIYLLWLDGFEEPEIWVYDVNGESRFKDLNSYLEAFINDDLSAVGQTWYLK